MRTAGSGDLTLGALRDHCDYPLFCRLQTTCRHYTYEELFWKGLTHLSLRPFWHRVSQEALVRIIEGKPLERFASLWY